MKILILTQKVDAQDNNLSFFHRWIEEFSRVSEHVTVICLERRDFSLPQNVRVFSLGKEKKVSRLQYIARLYTYVLKERNAYDAVFVHMNPIYLVLCGPLWRILHKRVALWYVHHSVDWKLRSGVRFADIIFTAARESFRLETKKPVHVVGHGIDVAHFRPRAALDLHTPLRIISDTRISRSKHVDRTLEISKNLLDKGVNHVITIIGAPITQDDLGYRMELVRRAAEMKLPIEFHGGVPYAALPRLYAEADILVNHANIGGLNKVVLQAMASNLYVLTSNEAYRGMLPDEQILAANAEAFAEKIAAFASHPHAVATRGQIEQEHALPRLIQKIMAFYSAISV